MTFSTRSNPRLAQGGAITSLGAVGGPRGISAGGLRILIEFLTSYDPAAMQKVKSDLAGLDAQEAAASAKQARSIQSTAALENRIARAQHIARAQLDRGTLANWKTYQQVRFDGTRKQASEARKQLTVSLNAAVASNKLTKQQAKDILEITSLQRRADRQKQKAAEIDEHINDLHGQRVDKEREYLSLAGVAPRLGARVAGLAIGAFGGIFGGAVLGVGFQLAQVALEKVGDAIQDIIDPSRHARDAAKELGDAVSKIASQEGLTLLQAASKYLKDLGINADSSAAHLLAEAAAQGRVNDSIDALNKVVEMKEKGGLADRAALIKKITDLLIRQDEAQGKLVGWTNFSNGEKIVNLTYYAAQAEQFYNSVIGETRDADLAAAAAKRELATATAIQTWQTRALTDALEAATARQTAPWSAQLQTYQNEGFESAKTKRLQDQLDALQSAGSGNQTKQLAEQRELLLLRQRLSLLGSNINLEKYSGKFLLEALNSKIAAIQKEASAQDRLNKLQDIQYQESQKIRRQEGESIEEFLLRRAKEQRDQLKARADLTRETQLAELNALKDKTQIEVDLADNAEAIKTAAAASGTSARIKQLQKELEASKKADRLALKSKEDALQAKIKAAEEAKNDIVQLATSESIEETKAIAMASRKQENMIAADAKLQGLLRAKNVILGLVEGFGLPQWLAQSFLDKINTQIATLEGWEERYFRFQPNPSRGLVKFASGGVFKLNNASSLFGSNIRTGEHGTELGVVLSNKVVQALRDNQGSPTFGNIIINKSKDDLHDRWAIRRTMREAMQEAIN